MQERRRLQVLEGWHDQVRLAKLRRAAHVWADRQGQGWDTFRLDTAFTDWRYAVAAEKVRVVFVWWNPRVSELGLGLASEG